MSHPFLSDLARRISLHPGCRVELRHHWPAPHYHKTPQDAAEEAEEMRRRQAARTASAASARAPPSSVAAAAAAAPAGGGKTSGSIAPDFEPFNPFDHFRVRKKVRGEVRRHLQRGRSAPHPKHRVARAGEACGPLRNDSPSATSSADAQATKKTKKAQQQQPSVVSEGSGGPTHKSTPTTATHQTSSSADAKVRSSKAAATSVSPPVGKVIEKSVNITTRRETRTTAAARTGTITSSSSASPVSQQQREQKSGVGPSPSPLPARKEEKEDHRRAKKSSSLSASAGDATPKDHESKKTERERAAAGKRGHHCTSRSSSSSSSSSSGTRRDSDLDSDELVPCRDPLNIRLPRNPVHHPTGGVPRPLHVTVRWSGAPQRRRRYNRQVRKRQAEVDEMPCRQVTQSPSGFEVTKNETSPNPSNPHPAQTSCDHVSMRSGRGNPAAVEDEEEDEDEDYDHGGHNPRSCSSDMKAHGEGGSPIRPPAASNTVGGGVSASASVATSHSLRPPSTIDEVSLLGCSDPSVELRHAQPPLLSTADGNREVVKGATAAGSTMHQQNSAYAYGHVRSPQQQHHTADDGDAHFARQPACKSATTFSQSTMTAPRTSLLGITHSELPTPSSPAEPYAMMSAHSSLRRPNSLLIIRSPPQDSSSEDVVAAANGLYCYPSSGLCVRSNTNMSAVGPHGLQRGNSSSSSLRVTYVTNNANWSGTTHSGGNNAANSSTVTPSADAASNAAQPTRLRGLAHAPRPYALTINGQGYPEGGNTSHIRSHSGSPTTVVVPRGSNSTTPPGSLPSTPLATTMMNVGAHAPSPAGQQTPPPLTMKAVLVQRRRSSLLRQQQQQQQLQAQQQQQQQQQRQQAQRLSHLPIFSFFPAPEALAASLLYQKTPGRTAQPKLQRVQSTASSAADTVAFSPLNVTVHTNTSSPSHSPPVPRGPLSVDALERTPLPTNAAGSEKSASPLDLAEHTRLTDPHSAHVNRPTSNITLHEDPQLLSAYGGFDTSYGFTPLYPRRDPSGLSTNGGGGGSSLRPLRPSQLPPPSHTDVPSSVPHPAVSGSFGAAGGGDVSAHYTTSASFGGGGDDNIGAGVPQRVSSSLPATTHYDATLHSLSFPTAMWMDAGDTDPRNSTLLHPLQQQQQQQQNPESPLGPWAYTRPCFYAPSENSAWMENTRLGAATPTAALTPMMPPASYYMGSSNTCNIFSEPATPMLLPQQQYQHQQVQRLPSGSQQQQQQQAASYSATSTPYLSHSAPPPAAPMPGTPGTSLYPAHRSRSNLLRAGLHPASLGFPCVPEVFCKLQRSDAQRLRRRGPVLPPGTECPGMAARLAYDAYRDAVRRGLVTEEEECSYYLSHHRCSPLPTPNSGSRKGGKEHVSSHSTTTTATTTTTSQASARTSDLPQPALHPRCIASPTPPAPRPLCVVSLADCRATSPATAKKLAQRVAAAAGKPHDTRTPSRKTFEEGGDDDGENEHSRSSSSGSVAQHSNEMSETWSGPRLLYHIPRCCDDPYHRDEEALEMISVTTASSCAFGAGLEGLSWREWMPSSPVEAGEEVLRGFASAAAATSTMPCGSAHAPHSSHVSTTMSGSTQAAPHTVCNGSVSFIVPSNATAAAGLAFTPINAGASMAASSLAVPGTPQDIAAPRNADDIGLSDAAADVGGEATRHHHTDPAESGGSAGDHNALSSSSVTASSKRPFIAEWLVSKLQKHLEKKKRKKLKKQQEREAATVAAVVGGGGGGGRSASPPMSAEEFSPMRADLGLSRGVADARRARSTTSTLSDYSNPSSPRSSGSPQPRAHSTPAPNPEPMATLEQQQHQRQRLAYLAAAYQTEHVIFEQKRRESSANRRGLSALVERSRTRMTPEAAAAGYLYEAQGHGSSGNAPHDTPRHHLHAQNPREKDSAPRQCRTASSGPHLTTTAAAAAVALDGEHHNRDHHHHHNRSVSSSSHHDSTTTYSSSYSQAIVSVASPVATDGDGEAAAAAAAAVNAADSRSKTPPAAAERMQHSPDALAPVLHSGRRQEKSMQARAMAEKMEAERRRVALDTVHAKHKSIETWICALQR